MPQFDPSTYLSQVFWLAFSFAALWGVVHFFILPPFEQLFSRRDSYINQRINQAIELQQRASHLKTKSAQDHKRFFQRTQSHVAQHSKRLDDQCAEAKEAFLQKINKEMLIFEKDLSYANAQAMIEIPAQAREIAQIILKKLHYVKMERL